ncbi:MAG TPA: SURF1 family protein [Gammaproteobacteria bacterium]|nr:SURF1 family protein [Gammaproteobacteria bacterium]
MFSRNYYFRFSPVGTVLAILGVALFASLGTWQVYRAIEKQQLQDDYDRKSEQPAFVLNENIDNLQNKMFLATRLVGHYDAENELLIDNTVYQGTAGYYVMTPFVLKDTARNGAEAVIMVNRGWIPVGRDRNQLPELSVPAGEITISGQLAPPKSLPPLILGELPLKDRVWPYLDMEKFVRRSGYDVLPLIILLDEKDSNGYVRDWPEYESRVGMHIGYAIQWYVFALIVLATYIGLNLKKREPQQTDTDKP